MTHEQQVAIERKRNRKRGGIRPIIIPPKDSTTRRALPNRHYRMLVR